MSNYKIIATDLDGTLLRADHTISRYSIEVLQKVIDQKIRVLLASSRPPPAVLNIANSISSKNCVSISLNGACVQLKNDDRFDCSIKFSLSEVNLDLNGNKNVATHIYHENEWWALGNLNLIQEEQFAIGYEPKIVNSMSEITCAQVNKILLQGCPELLSSIKTSLIRNSNLQITNSKPDYLDITSRQSDKWSAISKFISQNNIQTSEVIAFGDSENDLSMIKNAGLGIALANATDQIQQESGIVIGTNDDDSVAKYLVENILTNSKTYK